MIEVTMRHHETGSPTGHVYVHPDATGFTVDDDGDVLIHKGSDTTAVYINRTGDRITSVRIVEPDESE
jgi:hypothetical protein